MLSEKKKHSLNRIEEEQIRTQKWYTMHAYASTDA